MAHGYRVGLLRTIDSLAHDSFWTRRFTNSLSYLFVNKLLRLAIQLMLEHTIQCWNNRTTQRPWFWREKIAEGKIPYRLETFEGWHSIFKINTFAPFFVTAVFLELLEKGARSREGSTSSVINISNAAFVIKAVPTSNSVRLVLSPIINTRADYLLLVRLWYDKGSLGADHHKHGSRSRREKSYCQSWCHRTGRLPLRYRSSRILRRI